MRRIQTIAALLIMLVFTCAILAAASQTTVTVSVKNGFDRPLDNAAVILDFLGSHQVTQAGEAQADPLGGAYQSRGHCAFPAGAPGDHSAASGCQGLSDVWK